MYYISNSKDNELHTLEEIIDNKISSKKAIDMIIFGTEPHKFGAKDEDVLANLSEIKIYLFKESSGEGYLLNPDYVEIEIEQVYIDEFNTINYYSFGKIVSYKELRQELGNRGFDLSIKKVDDLLIGMVDNSNCVSIVKKDAKKLKKKM